MLSKHFTKTLSLPTYCKGFTCGDLISTWKLAFHQKSIPVCLCKTWLFWSGGASCFVCLPAVMTMLLLFHYLWLSREPYIYSNLRRFEVFVCRKSFRTRFFDQWDKVYTHTHGACALTYTYTCTHTRAQIRTHTYTRTRTCARAHTRAYARAHTHTVTHTHSGTHTYAHSHAHTRTHTRTHRHTHTHIHARAHKSDKS